LQDALGSTIGLVGSAQTMATSYTYQPFGATTVDGAANGNSYQFTGRENDGTELYFYRARYYNPTYQRFISQDPIGFAGGDPNLYAYARNIPTVWADALGWWIGEYPPPPPGYDPTTWLQTQLDDEGKYMLTDPNGNMWITHQESDDHWRHWDRQPPGGGGKNEQWPPNAGKPRSNQKRCKPDQSPVDPSGNAPDWQPISPDPNPDPLQQFQNPGVPIGPLDPS